MLEVKIATAAVKLKDLLVRLSLASLNFRSKRNIKKLDSVSSTVLNQFNSLYDEEEMIAVNLEAQINRAEQRAADHYTRIETTRKALEEYEDLEETRYADQDRAIRNAYNFVGSL